MRKRIEVSPPPEEHWGNIETGESGTTAPLALCHKEKVLNPNTLILSEVTSLHKKKK